jgi:CRISPR-associated endonuclease/helicase Cas3
VNISADHMISDLSTWESMAQRFGRVNRFGDCEETQIHVVYPSSFGKGDKVSELDLARQRTLALLLRLQGDASPANLATLPAHDKGEAFAPLPQILLATDILFDAWALTTIRDKLPGRPPVEPYLHGISDWEPPRTQIAWREEVNVLKTELLLSKYPPQDLLEDFPLKPHELLSDRSDRVFTHLEKLAERNGDQVVWLMEHDGTIKPEKLSSLADKNQKERIENRTVLLPPSIGGLNAGHLDGTSKSAKDVSCEWFNKDDERRRFRCWNSDETETKGMRLIRSIDTSANQESEDVEPAESTIWFWFERPLSGDSDGSRFQQKPVLWKTHTRDVEREATRIAKAILPQELQQVLIVAARFHDLGKRRPLFQRMLGNFDARVLLAKSGRRTIGLPERYRHEFGSLLEVRSESDFQSLSHDQQELVMHLIAVHHGRGRPHFPQDEVFDPRFSLAEGHLVAEETIQRFARLQRKYGRWGLAYLESLLRAADWEASANPSEFYQPQSATEEALV